MVVGHKAVLVVCMYGGKAVLRGETLGENQQGLALGKTWTQTAALTLDSCVRCQYRIIVVSRQEKGKNYRGLCRTHMKIVGHKCVAFVERNGFTKKLAFGEKFACRHSSSYALFLALGAGTNTQRAFRFN